MFSKTFLEEVRRDAERVRSPQAAVEPVPEGFLLPNFSMLGGTLVEDAAGRETLGAAPDGVILDEQALLERYRQHAGPIDVDGESYYLVEGDLLLDEDELEIYVGQQAAFQRQQQAQAEAQSLGYGRFITPDPGALVGMAIGGRIVRWKPGRVLTYTVRKQTFLNQQQYDVVRANMAQAAKDWSNVCGVQFEHRSQFDDGAGNGQVLFTVRAIDARGEFIASAFFPTDPPARRRVLIDHTYFTSSGFDPVGVLRHELGYVLGFRHEHIRTGAPAACPRESAIYGPTRTSPVTDYDPRSVMHYPCGGAGSRELRLTELDVAGAQRIYGPPLAGVLDIDV